jgi:hypothetical protein
VAAKQQCRRKSGKGSEERQILQNLVWRESVHVGCIERDQIAVAMAQTMLFHFDNAYGAYCSNSNSLVGGAETMKDTKRFGRQR